MRLEDRVALILGRAIIRAEALEAEKQQLQAQLTEFADTQDERSEVNRDP